MASKLKLIFISYADLCKQCVPGPISPPPHARKKANTCADLRFSIHFSAHEAVQLWLNDTVTTIYFQSMHATATQVEISCGQWYNIYLNNRDNVATDVAFL